jgi:hypothetical protein
MAEPETPPTAPPTTPNQATGPADAGPQRPPLREALDALERAAGNLREKDPSLADRVRDLVAQAADPVRFNQREFRHEIAYAVQDTEKALGHQLNLPPNARNEVDWLAGSAPGLENEQLTALLRKTVEIGDPKVVQEIRRTGAEIGRQADQNTETIRSQVDVLENKARSAPPAGELGPPPGEQNGAAATARADTTGRQSQTDNARSPEDQEQRRANPNFRYGTADPSVYAKSIVDGVIAGLRGAAAPAGSAPWDAAPQPLGERLGAFQNKMREGREDIEVRGAEKAGRAAMDAMEGFRAGEGATVMNRIQSAARSDPDGMPGVLSEMRDGGRYHELRQQFNNALKDEAGFARSYDQAAEALARYGEARTGIEQIIARRPDAANLTAKFQQLDAEIGEAAGNAPSRREGKTMLEDVSKQAGEIIQRAVDAVKSVFVKTAAPSASAAGPSPG